MKQSLLRLAGATVAIVVIGLIAGYAFGRTDARRAATLLVDDFVADEPVGTATEGPAPSSGPEQTAAVACGMQTQPLSTAQQVAALRAGVTVVQFRDESLAAEVAAWVDDRDGVVAARNEDLDEAVVGTAWGRRLRITNVNEQLLTAFATAYGGNGPDPQACGN